MLLAVMLQTLSSGKVWPTVPVLLASARAPTGQYWHDRPLRGSRRATAPEQGDDAHAGSAVLQPARSLSESLPVGHGPGAERRCLQEPQCRCLPMVSRSFYGASGAVATRTGSSDGGDGNDSGGCSDGDGSSDGYFQHGKRRGGRAQVRPQAAHRPRLVPHAQGDARGGRQQRWARVQLPEAPDGSSRARRHRGGASCVRTRRTDGASPQGNRRLRPSLHEG